MTTDATASEYADANLTDDEQQVRDWVLTREVICDKPTPSPPNGRYCARFPATKAELRAVEKAVDEALDRGEGLLSQVTYSFDRHYGDDRLPRRVARDHFSR